METVLISGGKTRRKTKVDNCKGCGKEFCHFPWDKQEYCSRECFYVKDKVKTTCCICGEESLKPLSISNRNTLNYCSRECYNNRNKNDLKKLKRHTKHYDELLESSSCACGVSEVYLLQIHHIDGDNTNNDPANQEVVCANCHIKRHLKKRKKDGKLVYHPNSLTDRELLRSL